MPTHEETRADQATVQAYVRASDLKSDDPRFDGVVHVLHQDGSSLTFVDAFAVRINDMVSVFSRRQGGHVFKWNTVTVRYYPVQAPVPITGVPMPEPPPDPESLPPFDWDGSDLL